MKIHVLDSNVANQIAAGEVVERPSSVVRELVDNAIDAGASQVTIALRSGGHAAIRILDNGAGMSAEDLKLAFQRHATSKLSALADLDSLMSLGFRGEALPSIASVSSVRMRTREPKSDCAYEIVVRGGQASDPQPTAGPVGTEVEVTQLFYNTPARRKFLKSERSEEMRIKQWLLQYALAHSKVHFRLQFDDREVLNLPPRENVQDRMRSLLQGASVPVDLTVNGIRVQGVLAHPSHARGDAHGLTTVVNQRLVTDRMLLRAAKDGFGSALKDREFPVGVLTLDLDRRLVDVNVHPQKSEVRFKDSSGVYVAILRSVQAAIADFKFPIQSPSTRPSAFSASPSAAVVRFPARSSATSVALTPGALTSGGLGVSPAVLNQGNLALSGVQVPADPSRLFEGPQLERSESNSTPGLSDLHLAQIQGNAAPGPFSFRSLRYIGQLLECYLLCEAAGRFFVVDMHAAHERYNYNLVRKALRERKSSSQHLLVPVELKLSEIEAEQLSQHEALLRAIGFAWNSGPGGALAITEVPSLMVGRNVALTLTQIAAIPAEDGGGEAAYEYLVDQIAARIACHASVRSGKKMSPEEAASLFALMDSSECSAACPHGRPVIVSFREEDVENWFGRDR